MFREPFQPDAPDALQVVALDDVQVSTLGFPSATWFGFAEIDTVGNDCGSVTNTVTLSDACPALFEQVIVYVVVFVGNTVWLPESDLEPLHPFVAEHEVALLDDQVSTELFPSMIEDGAAEITTVGNICDSTFTNTLSVAEPPFPVQVIEYVRVLVRLPLDWLPCVPAHPVGETEHEFAFVDVQLIVALALYPMVIGPSLPFALISTVGDAGGGAFNTLNAIQ